MPKLPDILVAQASVPKAFEAQAGMLPKISFVLETLARALPPGPDLPFPAKAGTSAGGLKLPRLEEVFKGPKSALTELQKSMGAGSTEEKKPILGIANRGTL